MTDTTQQAQGSGAGDECPGCAELKSRMMREITQYGRITENALSQPPEASEVEEKLESAKTTLKITGETFKAGEVEAVAKANADAWRTGVIALEQRYPPKASPMQKLQAMGQEFDANPAYQGCTCACHKGAGIMHVIPCCAPPKPADQLSEAIAQAEARGREQGLRELQALEQNKNNPRSY